MEIERYFHDKIYHKSEVVIVNINLRNPKTNTENGGYCPTRKPTWNRVTLWAIILGRKYGLSYSGRHLWRMNLDRNSEKGVVDILDILPEFRHRDFQEYTFKAYVHLYQPFSF